MSLFYFKEGLQHEHPHTKPRNRVKSNPSVHILRDRGEPQYLGVIDNVAGAVHKSLKHVNSALPILAKLLATSIDELLMGGKATGSKRGPTPKLQQQMERVSLLPRAKQKFVIEMIDTVIQQVS